MRRRSLSTTLAALALAASLGTGCTSHLQTTSAGSPTPTTPTTPLLVTVDHVFAVSAEAESLFVLFRDVFGLPVAWPFESHGDFASGGLSLGNSVVEFVRWEPEEGEVLRTEWKMLAFEPGGDTTAAVAELARRGVAHAEPEAAKSRDAAGKERVAWTNTELSGAGLAEMVFVCDYTAREKVAGMHRTGAEELARAGGGPLGLSRLQAIQVGVTDLDAARREWRKLIERPEQERGDVFSFGSGPAVELVRTASPGIRGIVLEVQSLAKARDFLASRQMLPSADGDAVAIAPSVVGGLTVSLVGE